MRSFEIAENTLYGDAFFYKLLQDLKENTYKLRNPPGETSQTIEFVLMKSGENEQGVGAKFEFFQLPFDMSTQNNVERVSRLTQKITYHLKIRRVKAPTPPFWNSAGTKTEVLRFDWDDYWKNKPTM